MDPPKRKHPRLKRYDYSLPGFYYVTIHTDAPSVVLSKVGRGLAPAAAQVRLTKLGEIARDQLLALGRRFVNVRVNQYVIMPTHIHMILELTAQTAGASPRPTLSDVVCTYKSLTTRLCNREFQTPGKKLFQTSFYETVLRNEAAYREAWQYIENNPAKWLMEENHDP